MTFLLAFALFAQTLIGPQAYTVTDADNAEQIDLAMDNGTYTIDYGLGCDGIAAGVNVEFLAGSGGVGAIVPIGSDQLCNVYINGKISDTPCAMTDGVCDVEGED